MGYIRNFVLLACVAISGGPRMLAQTPGGFDSAVEARVFAELNQARAEAGAPPLRLDPNLTDAARQHSLLLKENQKLSHQFPGEPALSTRLHAAGAYFTQTAENAGVNSDPDNITAMFLASPGHRVNMLNPVYNTVGIGVVRSEKSYWVTEDFTDEMQSLSSDEAANHAAAAFEAKWNHLHPEPVKRVNVAGLHTMACETATGGKLQGKPVTLGTQQARQVFAFSTADPSSLAKEVNTMLDLPHLQTYSVAACTPQESGDNGHFWILMAFF
jgi:hypothetical protein